MAKSLQVRLPHVCVPWSASAGCAGGRLHEGVYGLAAVHAAGNRRTAAAATAVKLQVRGALTLDAVP